MRATAHSAKGQAASMGGSWRAELLPRHAYQAAYTPDAPVIGFAFDGQAGIHAFASDRRVRFRTKPNTLHGEPWPWSRAFQRCDRHRRDRCRAATAPPAFGEWSHRQSAMRTIRPRPQGTNDLGFERDFDCARGTVLDDAAPPQARR